MDAVRRGAVIGSLFAVIFFFSGCGGSDGPDPLGAPSDLFATPVESGWIQLSWTDNSTIEDGFHIYRDGGSGFVLHDTVGPDFFGYSDMTDVVDGEFYTYYVVAFSGADESPHSNEVTVEAGEPYVTVLTPGDGETLTLGEMYDISWVTNVPDFDAAIWMSTDAGVTWPPQHQIQYSWAPKGSPYAWKVGYKNTEEDPMKPPVWEQVVFATGTEFKIFIKHYVAVGAQDWSEGTFTITVP
ncbi:MAG: hypothetical protein JW909_05875 [Planctomycetes bacterium]|nr:hypothetical protein [Planctomycetota bacterium]